MTIKFRIGQVVARKATKNAEVEFSVHGFVEQNQFGRHDQILASPTQWVVCKFLTNEGFKHEIFHEDELIPHPSFEPQN